MDKLKSMPLKNKVVLMNLLIVATIAGSLYFYWTIKEQITLKNNEVSLAISKRDVLNEQIASIEATNSQLANLTDIQSAMADILPQDKEQSDIVEQVIILAANNGLTTNDISFSNAGNDGTGDFRTSQTEALEGVSGVRFITMNFSVEASFETMLSFMEDLEKNQRVMQINGVTITERQDEESGESSLDVVFEVQIYVKG
jgi:Tfp pilus assembly protein PilO